MWIYINFWVKFDIMVYYLHLWVYFWTYFMPFCLPFSPRAFWGVNLVFCSFCFMASHRGGNFSAIKMLADTLTFSFFYSFHWFCNVVKSGFPLLTFRLLLTGWSWLSILPQNWQVTLCLFMLNLKKNYFWIYMPNWLKIV